MFNQVQPSIFNDVNQQRSFPLSSAGHTPIKQSRFSDLAKAAVILNRKANGNANANNYNVGENVFAILEQEQLPSWINNPKKRTIPGRVIERTLGNNRKSLQDQNDDETKVENKDLGAISDDSQSPSSSHDKNKSKDILSKFRKSNRNYDIIENPLLTADNFDDDEKPPSKSMFDLNFSDNDNDDDLLTEEELRMKNVAALTESINTHPDNFSNFFNSSPRYLLTNEKIASGNLQQFGIDNKRHDEIIRNAVVYPERFTDQDKFKTPAKTTSSPSAFSSLNFNSRIKEVNNSHLFDTIASPSMNKSINHDDIETAVLVYGYPDFAFHTVLKHFAKFGRILEDFGDIISQTPQLHQLPPPTPFSSGSTFGNPPGTPQSALHSRASNNNSDHSTPLSAPSPLKPKKLYPIFIGKNWVKITYDSPSSAIRAIRENGNFVEDDIIISVIPYQKEILEKLLNRKITNEDDIGGTTLNSSTKTELLLSTPSNKGENARINNILPSEIKEAEIPGAFREYNKSFSTPVNTAKNEVFDLTTNSQIGPNTLKIKDGTDLFINKHKQLEEQKKAENSGLLTKVGEFLFGFNKI